MTIGGTSTYRIADIENDTSFDLIGGYRNVSTNLYDLGGGDTHHPDIHALMFDPNNPNVFFTGTDGGVHRTDNVSATTVAWVNLNNNYQTYQYFDVFLDQLSGSDIVMGGAQDNGTTIGGTDAGEPNNTEMFTFLGGDGVSVGIGRATGANPLRIYSGFQRGAVFRFNQATNAFVSIQPTGTTNSIFVTLFHLDPDNNNALYYADGNRLFRTADAENVLPGTWDDLGQLPIVQNIRSMATTRGAYDPATSYILIGGQNGGVFRLDDPQNAVNFTSAVTITPPGASTTPGSIVSAVAIHPTNPDIAMAVYANYNITSIFVTSNATSATPTWTVAEQNLAPFSIRSAAILEVDGTN